MITDEVYEMTTSSQFCTVGVYSLLSDSDQKRQEIINEAGILGVKDVGRWIADSLYMQFKEAKIAKKLKKHIEMYVDYSLNSLLPHCVHTFILLIRYTVGVSGLEGSGQLTLIHKLFKVCPTTQKYYWVFFCTDSRLVVTVQGLGNNQQHLCAITFIMLRTLM